MFIDRGKIFVKAGDGGTGCNSFRYGSRVPRIRIPNGGDGGNGGDIIIKVDKNLRNLLSFRYKKHFKAKTGECGGSNNKRGRNADPCIIRVPPGTLLRDVERKNLFLGDLVKTNEELTVAKGGKGGKGNSKGRAVSKGEKGEARQLQLELKLIADVGIIGFPNSGKSTLISRLSNARPKVAPYPFTTLEPVVGILNCQDFREIVICDMPGIISGAHQGKGLGHDFLRHIERTNTLIYLIDVSVDNQRDPLKDYLSLNKELELYNLDLIVKPQIIVANKMDKKGSVGNFNNFRSRIDRKVYPVSGLTGKGMDKLIQVLCQKSGKI